MIWNELIKNQLHFPVSLYPVDMTIRLKYFQRGCLIKFLAKQGVVRAAELPWESNTFIGNIRPVKRRMCYPKFALHCTGQNTTYLSRGTRKDIAKFCFARCWVFTKTKLLNMSIYLGFGLLTYHRELLFTERWKYVRNVSHTWNDRIYENSFSSKA